MPARNVYIVLASGLFGVLVWFSVAMSEQYQVSIAAPLEIERVPEGKAIGTPVPPALQLRLRGSGWQLASLLWASNLTLHFPVQSFHGAHQVITRQDVAEIVAARPGIQLADMSPESVYVQLERRAEKTVPIALDCQVSFKDGYGQVGPTVISPESVSVVGAESVVRSLDGWSTVHGEFTSLRNPVEADLPLAPSLGYRLTLSVAAVRMRLNVEPFAEKTLSGLAVEPVAVPPNRELILIPPKIDIVARGGIRQLSSLAPGEFHVTVNYRNVIADSSGMVDADVYAPSDIQVVSKKPDKLQYVVRKRL